MIHELPNNYKAVPTPEGATDFEIMMGRLTFLNTGIGLSGITLPSSGQWQIVGLASEVNKEGVADLIVEGELDDEYYGPDRSLCKTRMYYTDYQNKGCSLDTALESFATLLASLALNPSTTIILKRV